MNPFRSAKLPPSFPFALINLINFSHCLWPMINVWESWNTHFPPLPCHPPHPPHQPLHPPTIIFVITTIILVTVINSETPRGRLIVWSTMWGTRLSQASIWAHSRWSSPLSSSLPSSLSSSLSTSLSSSLSTSFSSSFSSYCHIDIDTMINLVAVLDGQ